MLKSLITKAITAFESKSASVERNPVEKQSGQQLDLIVVPQSAMAAYPDDPNPLVEAVVDYVNFLLREAKFQRPEIPPESVQIYHTDYYLAQVNNGGHAQFVGNARAILGYTVNDVTNGLHAMGAGKHLELALKLARWIKKNPEEVDDQTGFEGGIAADLAALDGPFYELEKTAPIRQTMAAWIAQLPVLQVVEDAMMPRVLAGIKSLNPDLEKRSAVGRIMRLQNQMTNPMMLGLGMAGASASEVEPIISIGNGSYRDVDGQSQMTWFAQTVKGKRFGLVDETGACLREYIDENNASDMPSNLNDVTMDHIKSYVPVRVGRSINQVTTQQIEFAKTVCGGVHAAVAIDLLVGQLPEPTTVDFASVRSAGPNDKGTVGASIFLVANKASLALTVIAEEDGARLLSEPAHKELGHISRAKIDAFVAELKTA